MYLKITRVGQTQLPYWRRVSQSEIRNSAAEKRGRGNNPQKLQNCKLAEGVGFEGLRARPLTKKVCCFVHFAGSLATLEIYLPFASR